MRLTSIYVKSLAAAVIALVAVGCIKDPVRGGGGHIEFGVMTGAETRATVIDVGNIRKIGVFGYSHLAGTGWSAGSTPDYFFNKAVVLNRSEQWVYDGTQKYWPVDGRSVSFFAYAPHSDVIDPSYVITPASASEAGGPKITYTVPSFIGDQHDIVWSARPNMTYATSSAGRVSFTFSHALTTIGFEVRLDQADRNRGYTVDLRKITLSGVWGKGTFDLATGAWSSLTDRTSYSVHNVEDLPQGGLVLPRLDTDRESDFSFRSAIPAGYRLMLLPQTLDGAANVAVDYTVTDKLTGVPKQKTAVFGLSGTTAWARGGYVSYRLTISLQEP